MFDDEVDEDLDNEDEDDDEYPEHQAEGEYKEFDVCPYCGTLLNLINNQVNCPNCGHVIYSV